MVIIRRRRKSRHDIAIWAPGLWPLFSTNGPSVVGGAERQMYMVGKALADAGFRVCHIVSDSGDIPARSGAVTLVTESPDNPYRQFVLSGISSARVLARADAQVYIQRNAAFDTGVAAVFARTRGGGFIFSSSSDGDFTFESTGRAGPAGRSFRLGLQLANEIVVQSERQLELATQLVPNRRTSVIRSFCDVAPGASAPREAFLWIGGLIDYKGPLEYVHLAERLPQARFWMVGTDRGSAQADLRETVERAARHLPNLKLLEPRPRPELMELYRRAVAVVNTSRYEGFPNTFMEGWAQGAPALSLTVNPEGLLSQSALGVCAEGSLDSMVRAASGLWSERNDPRDEEHRRQYIARQHSPEVVGAAWIEVVERALGRSRRTRARESARASAGA